MLGKAERETMRKASVWTLSSRLLNEEETAYMKTCLAEEIILVTIENYSSTPIRLDRTHC